MTRFKVVNGNGDVVLTTKSTGRIESFLKDRPENVFIGNNAPRVEEEMGAFKMNLSKSTTSRDISDAYNGFYKF